MGQQMLGELGIPRKKVWGTFLHPETAPDARLRKEVEELLAADRIYSPYGMELQRERGRKGEDRLAKWLEQHGIGYRTEKDLRGKFAKTPDALWTNRSSTAARSSRGSSRRRTSGTTSSFART